MIAKNRNSGVDLLKSLSMFLVVLLHINTAGGALGGSVPDSAQWWIADLAQSASYCCVNCFALITGFLMTGRAFRPGRIVSSWMQVAFYSVVTAAAWYILMPGQIEPEFVTSAFFPVLNSSYWYFTAYFVMFFFTPFLNAMVNALDRHGRKMLLAAIFVFMSLLPTVNPLPIMPLACGYSAIWLSALYLVGACVKLDKLYERAGIKFFALVYFASVAVMLLWQVCDREGGMLLVDYLSPTVIACSVALLCAFCRLRVPDRLAGTAKFLSSTSFGVYLIHSSPFIWSNCIVGSFSFIGGLSPALVLPYEFGYAAAIYAACTLIEYLRQLLFKLCRLDRLAAVIARLLDRALLREEPAA